MKELPASPEKLIKLDCRRTGFCNHFQSDLELLLQAVARKFPKTGYYQGMNCIGGFLMKYTSDYDFSLKVFNYLMEKRLEIYFSDHFKNLKQLLFVSNKIFELYTPKFHAHYKSKNIGTEYFMSPIVLTLFTQSLQFIENFQLVATIIDIVIAEGWIGFFKVLVVIVKKVESKAIKMDYDELLSYLTKEIFEDLITLNFGSLKYEISKLTIPKGLLEGLGIQYEDTTVIIDNYWISFYEKRRPSSFNPLKIN
jgi:hypothetical protein